MFGHPVPWQEFGEAFVRVVVDAVKDVCEPGLGIDAVELCGLDQGVDGRSTLPAGVRACEQPVLAAERETTDGPLCRIVIDLEGAVIEVTCQSWPAAGGVADGACKVATPRDAQELAVEPPLQIIEDRPCLILSGFAPDVGWLAPDGSLYVVKSLDPVDGLTGDG